MDKRLALMTGIDIPIEGCQLVVHQPRIREIAYLGERDFFTGTQTICVNKKMYQGNNALENTTNFQIFMMIMGNKETIDKKVAVQQIMSLFFPNYKTIFTPRSIIFNGEGGSIIVDENNFELLQESLVEICCLRSNFDGRGDFNPADEKAAEIAKKLMRGRQIVAEQKGEANASVFTQYLSTLTVGLNSMSLEDCMNLTIYQLYDLIERYRLYVNWDIDIRARLAGAKPEEKVDNWMKNIH